MKHIVSKQWLLARLYEPDIVIADCRFDLSDPSEGRRAYDLDRIPGAVYFDLEQDLSGPVQEHGGRHPLPDVDGLAEKLGKAGIDNTVKVVAYDDQGGAISSRLWFLLKYMGHDEVYVLDEGYTAWKDAGFPVSSSAPAVVVPKTFVPRLRPEMLADIDEVREASRAIRSGDPSYALIDSREKSRYLGQVEPLDKAAGHIPGAINRYWKDNLDEKGKWKSSEELQRQYEDLRDKKQIIVYCGSGVTACPNLLALNEAGLEQVKLYAGSWSDWISYSENLIAIGEE